LLAFWLKWLAGVYLAAALETSLAPGWTAGYVAPDPFAMLGLVCLLVHPEARGVWSLALSGLAADCISATHPGVGMACFVAGGFVMLALCTRWPTTSVVGQAGLVTIGAWIIAGSMAACAAWLDPPGLAWSTLALRSIGVGLSTGVVSIPAFAVFRWREATRPMIGRRAKSLI